ncbi:MAG: hypothetical protein U0990_09785 [Candidatus Nanopelagicales bacterium]|nr:hypothetical protein [Candidatus Nanopelagicales bacterium]
MKAPEDERLVRAKLLNAKIEAYEAAGFAERFVDRVARDENAEPEARELAKRLRASLNASAWSEKVCGSRN